MNMQSLLSLLHLASPSLPIGAFAWSQGLESAIDMGWVNTEAELDDWLQGVLQQGLGQLDVPVFFRLYRAIQSGHQQQAHYWSRFLIASRETSEQTQEEAALGEALRKLLNSLGHDPGDIFGVSYPNPGYVSLFAWAAVRWGIPLEEALGGLLWSWLENQVMVACKTIPLGQTSAQKVLVANLPLIEQVIVKGRDIPDAQVGNTLPGLVMASCRHETQYSRLFRS